MNQTTMNFLVKTLGFEEAKREVEKLEVAAKKAGLTVKKYLGTSAGEQRLLAVQMRAANARVQEQAKSTNLAANAVDRNSRAHKNFFGHIAKTTVLSAGINQLFLQFVDVAGQAIQQVDAMNNFPATMASMGQSTKDAGVAFQALRDYVGEVGGNLGDATSYVTRFTGATGSVKAATAVFVGLNNALIAGDSSLEEQRGAMLQFAQALERGKIEAKEWNILTQNMSFQLNQVAQSMGYASSSVLRDAMVAGEESMASFTVALTKIATGTGSVVTQAEARMNGMQFAFNRMKNTMVQGLSTIINTIGRQNIVSFFTFLTQVIQVLAGWITRLISLLVTLFNFFARLFGLPAIQLKNDVAGIADGIGAGAENAGDLKDGLDDAGDSAKKLNKSLAAFDKMNVLPDKETGGGGKGSGDDGGAGGAGFDPGQLKALEDLFNGIGGGLGEASKWAKIFAGILAGIVGIKFAQGIINQIDGIAKSFKTASNGISAFKKALLGSTDESGQKVGGLAEKFKNLPVVITGSLSSLKGAFASLGGFLTNPYVLAAAAIAALVAGVIYLYNTNEDFKEGFDSIWGPIVDTLETVGKILWDSVIGAFEWLKKKFDEAIKPMLPTLQPVIDMFKSVGRWIKDMAEKLGLLDTPMKTLGKVIGVVAAVLAVNILAPILATIGGIIAAVAVVIGVILGIIWVVKQIWSVWQDTWTRVNNMAQKTWQFIQNIWDGVTEFFVNLWHSIYDIFMAAWTWLQEWGLTVLAVLLWPFTLMLAVVLTIVEGVKTAFVWLWDQIVAIWSKASDWFKVNVWDKIVAVFTGVTTWFKEKFDAAWTAIKEVWTVVSEWFRTEVWDKIVAVFSNVVNFYKGIFQAAWDGIKTIFSVVSTWFKTEVWDRITGVFSNVAGWFRERFQNAYNNITSVFSTLWSWFRDNVWNKIVSLFSSIGTSVADAIGGAFKGVVNTVLGTIERIINGFINTINWAIDTINKIPGVSIKKVPSVALPRLARGGVVEQATMAMIGENGAEAVVPLENNMEWLDKLAAKINSPTNKSSQPIQLTIQIGEEQIVTRVIDLINEKTTMGGRNTILV